jgi:biopolymer transport protein ExbB/TolQ
MSKKKTPEQLLQDIEDSRLELGKTLDQVQEQTRPEALGARVQRASIKVTDRLEEMALRKVDEISNSVGEAITRKGNDLSQMVRTHPLPATLVGIGVGLLAASVRLGQGRRRRRGGSWDADALRSEAADAATEFDERVGYMDSAGAPRRARRGANPLVVGFVAAALGVAIGLLIPASRYENGTLGPAGARLRARAWERARGAQDAAETTEVAPEVSVGEQVAATPKVEQYEAAGRETEEGLEEDLEETTERARDRAEEGR